MSVFDKFSGWQRAFLLWVGLPLLAAIGLFFGRSELVPAWRAKVGGGAEGTFTAVWADCGRRGCTWYGDFVAADGGQQRTNVLLYDPPDDLTVGQQVAARDTGSPDGVYPADGGYTYLIITGFVAGGLVAVVVWVRLLVWMIRRRRTTRL